MRSGSPARRPAPVKWAFPSGASASRGSSFRPVVGGGKVAFRRVPPYRQGAGRISRLGIEPARVLVVQRIDQAGRRAINAAADHAQAELPREVERQVLVVIRERKG